MSSLESDRPASRRGGTASTFGLALPARLTHARIGPWWLAPLLPAWVLAWLLLQLGPRAATDDGPLLRFANALLHGHYATAGSLDPVTYLWHGPGLPLLLAPMVWLHLPLWAMRLLTGPVLLFVAVVLFERLLRLRLGRRASLAGAYALGLYIPFGYLMRSLAKEELALVLVVTAMYATTRALADGRRRYLLLGGLALGGLVYDRLEYGWVMIAMLLCAGAWTLWRRRLATPRRVLAICAIAVASSLPWLAYTQHVTGRAFYWGNSGGLSLYWMSAPASPGYGTWYGPRTVFQDPRLAPERPFFRRIDQLTPLAADDALTAAAVRNIRTHPARYVLNIAANASRMLFAAPFGFGLSPALPAIVGLSSVLLLVAMVGTLRRWRRSREMRPPEAAPFALFLSLGFGIHLFPSADPRMLMPLIPVLVWFGAQRWATVRPRRNGPPRDDHAARQRSRHQPRLKPRVAFGSSSRPYPAAGARPRGHHVRARWIATAVTLALVAALVVFGVAKLNPAQVGRDLTHVKVGWVAVALILMAASFLARAESWFAVIGAALPSNRLGRRAITRGLLIGAACSAVAPGRVGEPARAWIIARRLGSPRRHLAVVLGTVISQTSLNLLALGILAVVTFAGAATTGARSEAIIAAIALPTGILTVVLAGPRLLRHAARSGSPRVRRAASWTTHQLTGIRRGLAVFRHPRAIAHAAGAQLNGWALQLGACYAVILALGLEHHATVAAAAAVLLAINLTAILPIMASNFGAFQAAGIAALASFGVAASQGLAYGLILQAVEIASALALGLVALLREGLSLTELSHQARIEHTDPADAHA